jgi:hypothetical protein
VARQADVLAAVAKANAMLAQTAPARQLAAKHQRELALAAKAFEQTAKARQVLAGQQKLIAETQKVRQMMADDHKRMRRLIKAGQLAWIRARVRGPRQARPHVTHRARQGRRCAGRPAGQRTSSRGSPSGLAGGDEPPPEPELTGGATPASIHEEVAAT